MILNQKIIIFLLGDNERKTPSRMWVLDRSKGMRMAYHVGRCQPKHATSYDAGQASWSRTSLLMQAFTPSIRFLVNCDMALHKLIVPAASSHSSAALWIAALCVSLSFSASKLRLVIPFLVPSSYGSIGVLFSPCSGYSSPCIRSLDNSLYTAMPREWPRMGSRRGGSRGRAASHRSTPISYSSLDALEPGRSSPPVTRSGRGRGRGRVGRVDCEHAAHPTVRYRILCSLAKSTFIVSVTIEKCEDIRGLGAAHPGALAEQRMANRRTISARS